MIVKYNKFNEKINYTEVNNLTLYTGTSEVTAEFFINNGWKPRESGSGGNMGQSRYLYLTSEPENARWYANENGYDTIVEVSNIPIEYLYPDPEDETGFSMKDLLTRMSATGLPSNFVLIKQLDKKHFKIYNK